MSSLLLDSLEIRSFRAFRRLSIQRLGRVNLIVGKNAVGKSCLLEALWLYAHRGSVEILWDLLEARDERRPEAHLLGKMIADFGHLFYGREFDDMTFPHIIIGPSESRSDERTLSIEIAWNGTDVGAKALPTISTRLGTATEAIVPIGRYFLEGRYRDRHSSSPVKPLPGILLSPDRLDLNLSDTLWDEIAHTELAGEVLGVLRIIAPDAEKVEFVTRSRDGNRIPIIKLNGYSIPVPLRSLGAGLYRIFGIALAVANAKGGLALIDEIENGLHYTIQTDLWRAIFQLAHRLDIQVFATTHSWDCVEAFQAAAQESEDSDALLVRLEKGKKEEGEITTTLFDKRRLAIATRDSIEIR